MARRQPLQTDFSSGQISKYAENSGEHRKNGLKKCENFIPLAQGALIRRPGSTFIHKLDGVTRGKIIPFKIDDDNSYSMIITNDGKIRISNRDGMYQIPTGGLTAYVDLILDNLLKNVPSATLFRAIYKYEADVSVKEDYAQIDAKGILLPPGANQMPPCKYIHTDFYSSVDVNRYIACALSNRVSDAVIYKIVVPAANLNSVFKLKIRSTTEDVDGMHPGHYNVMVMSDYKDFSSSIAKFDYVKAGDTFEMDVQVGNISVLYITLRSWEGVPDHVGMFHTPVFINHMSMRTDFDSNNVSSFDHDFGDIDYSEIQWAISPESNYVYLSHRAVEPSRVEFRLATQDFVYSRLITDHIIDHKPADWGADNWPGSVLFFGQRLWYAGTEIQRTKFWASKVEDYNDFHPPTATHDDNALEFRLSQYGDIRWLASSHKMVVGTDLGEYTFLTDGAITPQQLQTVQQSSYGCARVQPVVIGNRIIYVSEDRLKLRDFTYNDVEHSWLSQDLTFNSEDITASGIMEISLAQNPYHLVRCRLRDGKVAVCSYQKHLDIVGWYVHKSYTRVISSGETVNNGFSEATMLTYDPFSGANVQMEDAGKDNFLDSRVIQFHSDKSVNVHAPHLKNMVVDVFADGASQRSVALDDDGNGKLQFPAREIHVGIEFRSIFVTNNIILTDRYGESSVSLMKRWNKIFVRLHNSAIPIINGDQPASRTPQDLMDKDVELVNGDVEVVDLSYDKFANIEVIQSLPLPCSVLGVFGELGEENL